MPTQVQTLSPALLFLLKKDLRRTKGFRKTTSLFHQAEVKDLIPDLAYVTIAKFYNYCVGEVFVSSVKGLEHLVQGTFSITL